MQRHVVQGLHAAAADDSDVCRTGLHGTGNGPEATVVGERATQRLRERRPRQRLPVEDCQAAGRLSECSFRGRTIMAI